MSSQATSLRRRIALEVWTDYACPYSFVASLRLERLRSRYDLAITWRSFLLRPAGTPPLTPALRQRMAEEHEWVARLVGREFGLKLAPGPLGPRTYFAHVATKFAERQGQGDRFHAALMEAYWLRSRAIQDPTVLADLARAVGLSAGGLDAALEDGKYAQDVEADLALASKRRVPGVPTVLLGDRYCLSGAQRYPLFERVTPGMAVEDRY